ncbi:MAG: pyridoxal-phosphate dependent enzyme [Anaerolineae bacterium]|nr:pyridoxal-phosphate dependent enzyme [Anaerolineae bacterium]
MTHLICSSCGQPAAPLDWQCRNDGQPLEIADLPAFDTTKINSDDWSVWRYEAMLPVTRQVSLGEGGTPLVETSIQGMQFHAKLEYLNPTGSYKDRGTVTLLNYLLAQGVTEVIEDSSGNAGASLAAYAAAAGITARIYTPESAPVGKKRLITSFGARLVEIPGPRAATTQAILDVAKSIPYATHAWNPYFGLGQMTIAWEVWEQLGRRAPDAVVCPVGQGGLFLGFARGFKALRDAGLIERLPKLYAAQSAACDPIVRAWEQGRKASKPVTQSLTVADGIVITQPVRNQAVLAAIYESEGGALRVADGDILAAKTALNQRGLIVEPTSAVPVAALLRAKIEGTVVIPLTGSGLKTL